MTDQPSTGPSFDPLSGERLLEADIRAVYFVDKTGRVLQLQSCQGFQMQGGIVRPVSQPIEGLRRLINSLKNIRKLEGSADGA